MLYKYLPAERISVLERLEVRFSQPRALNDPFEATPLLDASLDRLEFMRQMENDLQSMWANTDETEKTPENYELLQAQLEALKEDVAEKMSPGNIGAQLMDRVNESLGVLSLSRTFTNLLMWSHYCNRHSGFVIGFDDTHEYFYQQTYHGLSSRPNHVNYTSQRSMVRVGDHDYYEKLLCEKSIDWAYEEEVRIFRLYTDETKVDGQDSAGYPIFLIDLPKDAVKSIYLGAHADAALRRKVFAAINTNNLAVDVYETRLSKMRYELEWFPILQE